ncbi:hypothetical protein J2T13_001270 [Paenibacillus sp. DS2015]
MLRLDFAQAFRYNPLIFILLPLYTMYFLTKKKQMRRSSNGIMVVMLTLTLAFGLLRNIPFLDFLAPTIVG